MAHHDDAPLADVLAEVVADTDTKAVFRRLLEQALQELIESELSGVIGAERHERTDTRTNQRMGGGPVGCGICREVPASHGESTTSPLHAQ